MDADGFHTYQFYLWWKIPIFKNLYPSLGSTFRSISWNKLMICISAFIYIDILSIPGWKRMQEPGVWWGPSIPVHYYDGLKFACMDFSSKQQKRRKALRIQTDLFLSFLITQLSFPINEQVWGLQLVSKEDTDGRDIHILGGKKGDCHSKVWKVTDPPFWKSELKKFVSCHTLQQHSSFLCNSLLYSAFFPNTCGAFFHFNKPTMNYWVAGEKPFFLLRILH